RREVGSEVDLSAYPKHVVRLLGAAPGGEDNAGEDCVFPADVDLDELVQVPVATDVDQLGAIGPEEWVDKSGSEDPGIEVEFAVPDRRLERAEAELPLLEAERMEWIDERAIADRLTRYEVPGLREPAVDRDARLRRGWALCVALVAALPRAHE